MEEHPPLKVGDILTFEPEPTNERDPNAVLIKSSDRRVGYINRLQASAFLGWLD
jgi:hypothetical protein